MGNLTEKPESVKNYFLKGADVLNRVRERFILKREDSLVFFSLTRAEKALTRAVAWL